MTGRHGTPRERLERLSIPEPNSGCWLWLGSVNKNGYAQMSMPGGKPMRAHRVSFKIYKGQSPKGKDIRHTCDMRCCVNPDHLIPGTRLQNMNDARVRGRIAKRFTLPHTKLTDKQIILIIGDRRSQRVIAAEYGIDQSYVSLLKIGARRT